MPDSRKSGLSPAGDAVRKALTEATKIVTDSSVGKFLLEKQDSPEGFATLVAAAQQDILRHST